MVWYTERWSQTGNNHHGHDSFARSSPACADVVSAKIDAVSTATPCADVCDDESWCNGRGTCDRNNGFCECQPEWTGDRCQRVRTKCDPDPCNGHGTCNIADGSCVCDYGFKSAPNTTDDCLNYVGRFLAGGSSVQGISSAGSGCVSLGQGFPLHVLTQGRGWGVY
jgi:hypothetical protein